MSEWNYNLEEIPKDKPIIVLLSCSIQAVMAYENDIERWTTQGWEDCLYCGGQSQADVKDARDDIKLIIAWQHLPEPPKTLKQRR
jgi:hypothetical protein